MFLYHYIKKLNFIIDNNDFVKTVEHVTINYNEFNYANLFNRLTFSIQWFFCRIFYKRVRKQPCLYKTLLDYAKYLSKGIKVHVNTIISIGDSSITDAHCWLSEKNISKEKIKTQKKYINKEHISFKNNIHYWIQRSADETRRI